MTPFDCLIEDIFNNHDMTEQVTVQGRIVRAGVSVLEYAPGVTDFGMDSGENFYLTIKAADAVNIRRGVLLTYRNKQYKVTSTETDSAGLTTSIYLKSLTTA
jgi:hypothetical protein